MGFEDFLNKPAPADDKRPQIEKEQEKLRGRKDEIDNFSDEVSYALKKHPDWTVGDFEDEMWKLWKKNEAEEKTYRESANDPFGPYKIVDMQSGKRHLEGFIEAIKGLDKDKRLKDVEQYILGRLKAIDTAAKIDKENL